MQAGCSGRCAEEGIWEEGEPRRGAEAGTCKGPQEAAEGSRATRAHRACTWPMAPALM